MVDIKTLETELSTLGIAREKAATRRQVIFAALRQLSIKAEAGDRKAVAEQGPLNKSAEDESRLIVRIDREMNDVKRRLDLARGQSAVMASRAAAAQSSTVEHAKWFEVSTPSGRVVRYKHASLESIRAALEPGYTVRSEIFGCDENGEGGFPVACGSRKQLLAALHAMSEA
jgi:hypothetical protein